MALRFAELTGASPKFWMQLQAAWDLWHALQALKGRAA